MNENCATISSAINHTPLTESHFIRSNANIIPPGEQSSHLEPALFILHLRRPNLY